MAICYYYDEIAYTRFFGSLFVAAGFRFIFVRELLVDLVGMKIVLKGWRRMFKMNVKVLND